MAGFGCQAEAAAHAGRLSDSRGIRFVRIVDVLPRHTAMTTDSPALKILTSDKETKGGSYFVSNYPPYSFWNANRVGEAFAALERPPAPGTALVSACGISTAGNTQEESPE